MAREGGAQPFSLLMIRAGSGVLDPDIKLYLD